MGMGVFMGRLNFEMVYGGGSLLASMVGVVY